MNPLIQAIKNNNPHQLKLLLDVGHDPNKEVADEEFLRLKIDPLSIAPSNNIGYAEVLLKAGVNLKTIINPVIFVPPLMHAAHSNLPVTAQLLIEHGADLNYCNDLNITSLIEASKNSAMEVAKLLLENGADTHVVEWEGYTALEHAKQRRNTELILEIGKYPNTQK